jgi:hypothetical protein
MVGIVDSVGEIELFLALAEVGEVAPNARDLVIRFFATLNFNLFTSALSALTIFSSVFILVFFDMASSIRFSAFKLQTEQGVAGPTQPLFDVFTTVSSMAATGELS